MSNTNAKAIGNVELKITLSKENISEEAQRIFKDCQKQVDKNTITYKIAGDNSKLEAMLKDMQKLTPEILTTLAIDFDKQDYDRQLDLLKKSSGKKAEEIGKNFKKSFEESFNFNINEIIGDKKITSKNSISELSSVLKGLISQTNNFDLSKVTSLKDVEEQFVALNKMKVILKELQGSGRKYINIDDNTKLDIADSIKNNTKNIDEILENVGDIIKTNASQWATNLESAFNFEFSGIKELIECLKELSKGTSFGGNGGNSGNKALNELNKKIEETTENIESLQTKLKELNKVKSELKNADSYRSQISNSYQDASLQYLDNKNGGEVNKFKKLIENYMLAGGKIKDLASRTQDFINKLGIKQEFSITDQINETTKSLNEANAAKEKLLQDKEKLSSGASEAEVDPKLSNDFKIKLQEQIDNLGSVDVTVAGKLSDTFKADIQGEVDNLGTINIATSGKLSQTFVDGIIDAEKSKFDELIEKIQIDVPTAIEQKNKSFTKEKDHVKSVVNEEIVDLIRLQQKISDLIRDINSIADKTIKITVNYSSLQSLYQLGENGKSPVDELKESLDGLKIGTLKELKESFQGFSINKNLSNGIKDVSKAIDNLKVTLSNIDPNGIGFLSTIKELTGNADALKDIATIIKSSADDIKKAQEVATNGSGSSKGKTQNKGGFDQDESIDRSNKIKDQIRSLKKSIEAEGGVVTNVIESYVDGVDSQGERLVKKAEVRVEKLINGSLEKYSYFVKYVRGQEDKNTKLRDLDTAYATFDQPQKNKDYNSAEKRKESERKKQLATDKRNEKARRSALKRRIKENEKTSVSDGKIANDALNKQIAAYEEITRLKNQKSTLNEYSDKDDIVAIDKRIKELRTEVYLNGQILNQHRDIISRQEQNSAIVESQLKVKKEIEENNRKQAQEKETKKAQEDRKFDNAFNVLSTTEEDFRKLSEKKKLGLTSADENKELNKLVIKRKNANKVLEQYGVLTEEQMKKQKEYDSIVKNSIRVADDYANKLKAQKDFNDAYDKLAQTENNYQALKTKEELGLATPTDIKNLEKLTIEREEANKVLAKYSDLTEKQMKKQKEYNNVVEKSARVTRKYKESLEKQSKKKKDKKTTSEENRSAKSDKNTVNNAMKKQEQSAANIVKLQSQISKLKDKDGNLINSKDSEEVEKLEIKLQKEQKIFDTNQEILESHRDIISAEEQENKLSAARLEAEKEIAAEVKKQSNKDTQKDVKNTIGDFSRSLNGALNNNIFNLDSLEEQLKTLRTSVSSSVNLSELSGDFDGIINKLNEFGGKVDLSQFTESFRNSFVSARQELQSCVAIFERMENGEPISDEDLAKIKAAVAEMSKVYSEKGDAVNLTYNENTYAKLYSNMTQYMNKISGASKELRKELSKLINDLQNLGSNASKQDVTELANKFVELQGRVRAAGQEVESFWDKFKKDIITKSAGTLAQYFSLYDIINYGRQAFSISKQYDTALTEMRKVTDKTVSSLKRYQRATFDVGNEIGTTAKQVQLSTADFLRVGESFEESAESAKAATTLYNVSEFESIDEATDALIAMSSAYKELTKTEINDILNELGNNYAISSDGLATALQKSASSLKTAGNDLYEASALITAANTIAQDPDSVGAGMRTIALRLTGTSAEELSEMGEDTDGLIESTSKLREVIKGATAVASNDFKGFDILDENGNFKSTYEIMLGISEIYKEIEETDKKLGNNNLNLLLETVAGKNRANIAASVFQSPEILKDAYESALNSEGSSQAELDKYLDSLEAKTTQLTNSLHKLATTVADADILKYFIDFGTGVIDTLDKIIEKWGFFTTLITGFAGFKGIQNKGIDKKQSINKCFKMPLLICVL